MKGGLLDLTFVPAKDAAPQTLFSLLSGQKVHTRFFFPNSPFSASNFELIPRVIVREFRLEDVPEQQDEASTWLHKLWLEKDKIKEKALEEDWEGLEEMGIKPFEGKGVGRVMALQRLPSIQTQLISHDQALSCTDLDFILWGDRKCSCYLPPFLSHNTGK